MTIVTVTTQAELDAALKKPDVEIRLGGSGVFVVAGRAPVYEVDMHGQRVTP